ncbi:30S ribosomal protein S6--L-glutamate ligase [Myxococcota bacterium]|nr:30S ribosomal protein S6--L-glutamate ligase [Myxococcota bacterium]MBU1431327.1 30S ribosomal protein S6--L-glutamate ligase [Myxococcota bacterium]MBU1897670.1 30S ribosomal protein S6--L-glutamate ligase [Myxococcota bacterium]
MKALILSVKKASYSIQRLIQEYESAGHVVDVINPLRCILDLTTGVPYVYSNKKRLDDYDIVLPRIGASINAYGLAVIRQFEMFGTPCVNTVEAVMNARDKFRSLQLLSKRQIPLPKTSFASMSQYTQTLIKRVGGAPTVIKLLEGSQGRGVFLGETQKSSEGLIDAFRELNASFIVQEFISDAQGKDIRCFVVGGEVVASMMRVAKKGEFRSNIHRGGTGILVELTAYERAVALAAAQAMGLNIAGVDLIRAADGPRVLEVNSSPGLEGIERTTRLNIAGEIVRYTTGPFMVGHATAGPS